jgi:hypothetical protein
MHVFVNFVSKYLGLFHSKLLTFFYEVFQINRCIVDRL